MYFVLYIARKIFSDTEPVLIASKKPVESNTPIRESAATNYNKIVETQLMARRAPPSPD